MEALALTKRIGANAHNHKVNNVLVPKKEVGKEEEEEEDMDVDDRDEKMKKKNNIGGVDGSLKKGGRGSGSILRCCRAERCSADLSEAKQYHKRHKVCEHHAKAQVVIVAGIRQRFCQQCSRFHEVSEFDEAKRSCRRRLAGHNERRRKSSSTDNPHADGISGVGRKVTAAAAGGGGGSSHDMT